MIEICIRYNVFWYLFPEQGRIVGKKGSKPLHDRDYFDYEFYVDQAPENEFDRETWWAICQFALNCGLLEIKYQVVKSECLVQDILEKQKK